MKKRVQTILISAMIFICANVPNISGYTTPSLKLVDYWSIAVNNQIEYKVFFLNDKLALEHNGEYYLNKNNLLLFSINNGEKVVLPKKLQQVINKNVSYSYQIYCYDGNIYLRNGDKSIAIYNYKNDSIRVFKTDYNIYSYFIVNNHILVTSNVTIYCYNIKDLIFEWEYESGDYVDNICHFDNYIVLPCQESGKLSCIDLKSGNELWKINNEHSGNYMKCAMTNEKIIAFNGGQLECYDKIGNLLWVTKNLYSYNDFIIDGNGIIVFNLIENKIVTLNNHNGSILWEFELPNRLDSLVANSNYLLCSCKDYFYVLERRDGNLKLKDNMHILALGNIGQKYILQEYDKIKCSKLRPSLIKLKNNSNIIIDQDSDQYAMNIPLTTINKTSYCEAKSIVGISGGTLTYGNSKKTVEIYFNNGNEDIMLSMQINNPTATLNGKQVQIDPKNPKITPIIINGRTMVPLRFLAESLGCKVEWKADTKEIIVTYQP